MVVLWFLSELNKDNLIVTKKRQYWITLQEVSFQPWNNGTIYPHISKRGESNNSFLWVGNRTFLMKERDQVCLRYSHNSQLIRHTIAFLIPWHLTAWRVRGQELPGLATVRSPPEIGAEVIKQKKESWSATFKKLDNASAICYLKRRFCPWLVCKNQHFWNTYLLH